MRRGHGLRRVRRVDRDAECGVAREEHRHRPKKEADEVEELNHPAAKKAKKNAK